MAHLRRIEPAVNGFAEVAVYGLVSALAVFIISTAACGLADRGHRSLVWLASATIVTAISCSICDPVLSTLSRSRSSRHY